MQLGIFAKTFPGSAPVAVLQQVADAGYACTQFNMACAGLPSLPAAIPDAVATGVAAAARTSGVAIAAVSGTCNLIHPDQQARARALASLFTIIAAAPAMGSPMVTLCTGTREPHDMWRHHPGNAAADAWADLLDSMAQVVEHAERHNVDLGIEPELANVVSDAPRARRLLNELASPRLRIVLDPANLFEVASDAERRALIERAVDLLADRIAMAHAKDRTPGGGFATAGTGVIDFAHFLGCLRAAGFDGPLVTHGLAADEAAATAAFLRRTLDA